MEDNHKEKFCFKQLTNNEHGKTSPLIVLSLIILSFTLPLFVYTVIWADDVPMAQQVSAVILGVIGMFSIGGFAKKKI